MPASPAPWAVPPPPWASPPPVGCAPPGFTRTPWGPCSASPAPVVATVTTLGVSVPASPAPSAHPVASTPPRGKPPLGALGAGRGMPLGGWGAPTGPSVPPACQGSTPPSRAPLPAWTALVGHGVAPLPASARPATLAPTCPVGHCQGPLPRTAYPAPMAPTRPPRGLPRWGSA